MKPQEFRIGNLLREKFSGTIIEVESIQKNSITFTGEFVGNWKAEQIPLSEAWIEKLGVYKGMNAP